MAHQRQSTLWPGPVHVFSSWRQHFQLLLGFYTGDPAWKITLFDLHVILVIRRWWWCFFFATHSNEVDNKCERAGPPHPQSMTKLIVWSHVMCLLVPTVVEVDDLQCQSMNWKCTGLNQAVLTKPANVDGIPPTHPQEFLGLLEPCYCGQI